MFIYQKKVLHELEYIFKDALPQEVALQKPASQKPKKIHDKIGRVWGFHIPPAKLTNPISTVTAFI